MSDTTNTQVVARRWTSRSVFSAFFGFVWFILRGLTWPVRVIFRRDRRPVHEVNEVVFYVFHRAIYVWLLGLVSLVAGFAVKWGADPEVFGWIWVWTFLFTMITLLFDVGRNKMIMLAIIAFAIWAGGYILQRVQSVPILTWIYDYFAGLDVQLNPGLSFCVSIFMGIIVLGVLFHAFLDGKVRLTPNEIEVFHFGRSAETYSRIGKRIREDFRDWNETVLLIWGADLIVRDPHGQVERTFENIPFLRFMMRRIDRILETWNATTTPAAAITAATTASS